MKKETRALLTTLSYIALIITALLLAVEYILPSIITLGAVLSKILNTVKNVLIVIVIGINAYTFTEGKAKWILWVFWIAIIIIIVVTVLMWIL